MWQINKYCQVSWRFTVVKWIITSGNYRHDVIEKMKHNVIGINWAETVAVLKKNEFERIFSVQIVIRLSPNFTWTLANCRNMFWFITHSLPICMCSYFSVISLRYAPSNSFHVHLFWNHVYETAVSRLDFISALKKYKTPTNAEKRR